MGLEPHPGPLLMKEREEEWRRGRKRRFMFSLLHKNRKDSCPMGLEPHPGPLLHKEREEEKIHVPSPS